MPKPLNESELERLYQKYLKEGYYKEWAMTKAKHALLGNRNKPITVDVAGVGSVSYTGD